MLIINYLLFLLIDLFFHQFFHNYQTFDSKGNLQIPSALAVLGETKLIFWSMGKKKIAPKK